MKYLIIYWIWIDCTISITIEKIDSCDFTKKSKQIFHSNEHIKRIEKTKFVKKITFIWKMTRIMLEAFVSKSILYVYQNARWNQRKIAPQIYQNIPPKKYIFLRKKAPS